MQQWLYKLQEAKWAGRLEKSTRLLLDLSSMTGNLEAWSFHVDSATFGQGGASNGGGLGLLLQLSGPVLRDIRHGLHKYQFQVVIQVFPILTLMASFSSAK